MAGSVAHVLGIDFWTALRMPTPQLAILHNEAKRQRALDAIAVAAAQAGKDGQQYIDDLMKAHGPYTAGFFEQERKRLRSIFRKENGRRKGSS